MKKIAKRAGRSVCGFEHDQRRALERDEAFLSVVEFFAVRDGEACFMSGRIAADCFAEEVPKIFVLLTVGNFKHRSRHNKRAKQGPIARFIYSDDDHDVDSSDQ